LFTGRFIKGAPETFTHLPLLAKRSGGKLAAAFEKSAL
jgi:hypothetical protein